MAGEVSRGLDNSFLEMLGIELVELRKDRCILEMELGEQHLNRQGTLHGGLSATLLDAACGYAAVSLDDHSSLVRGVTVMLSVNFLSQARFGRVRAEATVERRGRSIAYCESRLTTVDGELVAAAHAAFKFSAPIP